MDCGRQERRTGCGQLREPLGHDVSAECSRRCRSGSNDPRGVSQYARADVRQHRRAGVRHQARPDHGAELSGFPADRGIRQVGEW